MGGIEASIGTFKPYSDEIIIANSFPLHTGTGRGRGRGMEKVKLDVIAMKKRVMVQRWIHCMHDQQSQSINFLIIMQFTQSVNFFTF